MTHTGITLLALLLLLGVYASGDVSMNITSGLSPDVLEYYFQRGHFSTTNEMIDRDNRAWYPTTVTDRESLPTLLYVCGSLSAPRNYGPTLDLVASWGFVVIGIANDIAGTTCTPTPTLNLIDLIGRGGLPSPLNTLIDPQRIITGGHSGGGPCALQAAGQRSNVVIGTIPQHSAAIPLVNRLSDRQIATVTGTALVICGTADVMPFCGCGTAQNDIFDRFRQPSMLVQVAGATHVLGVQGTTGRDTSGGFIVAFLQFLTQGGQTAHDARNALIGGRANRNDKITDRLG